MSFAKDGYQIIESFWPDDLLTAWEDAIIDLYTRQAKRSGWHCDGGLDDAVQWFEKHDQDAGYQVLQMLELTPAAKRITSYQPLIDLSDELLGGVSAPLLYGPHPFINQPGSKRLLYKWHSESCYYPKRRNFLNVWSPLFDEKHEGNGTMWVAKGSHEHAEWQFVEYQGYDASGQKRHFVQYEIPATELDQYEKVPILAKRRDLVVFARSLAHSSTPNLSDTPSYASVLRVFDYERDLTLAGNPAVQPFTGKDCGRPTFA